MSTLLPDGSWLRQSFGGIVGRSPATRALFTQLERAADSEVTVLLLGDTGTGKEVAARAIHHRSARSSGPLVVVDCGSISPTLIDSELFGHEKGAFTGADRRREGAFELAHGGTIFLDEIGELTSDLQPRLLGVLERREVQRIGGARPTPVDVRIIAATNRDLSSEVHAGRFRSDLYYRLAVLQVRLPTLRERIDDIPLLVEQFLRDSGVGHRPEAAALRGEAFLAGLARHPWRGNIRELRNYLERALVEPGPEVAADTGWEAPPEIDTSQKLSHARETWVHYMERQYITRLLERHHGNVSATARAAGIDRAHFYRIMAACGLRREPRATPPPPDAPRWRIEDGSDGDLPPPRPQQVEPEHRLVAADRVE